MAPYKFEVGDTERASVANKLRNGVAATDVTTFVTQVLPQCTTSTAAFPADQLREDICLTNCVVCFSGYYPVSLCHVHNDAAASELVRRMAERNDKAYKDTLEHVTIFNEHIVTIWQNVMTDQDRREILTTPSNWAGRSLSPTKFGICHMLPKQGSAPKNIHPGTWLVPWLDLETLVTEPPALPLLVGVRAAMAPREWARFDHRNSRLAQQVNTLPGCYSEGMKMVDFAGDKIVVSDWDQTKIHSRDAFGFKAAIYTMQAQYVILSLLGQVLRQMLDRFDKEPEWMKSCGLDPEDIAEYRAMPTWPGFPGAVAEAPFFLQAHGGHLLTTGTQVPKAADWPTICLPAFLFRGFVCRRGGPLADLLGELREEFTEVYTPEELEPDAAAVPPYKCRCGAQWNWDRRSDRGYTPRKQLAAINKILKDVQELSDALREKTPAKATQLISPLAREVDKLLLVSTAIARKHLPQLIYRARTDMFPERAKDMSVIETCIQNMGYSDEGEFGLDAQFASQTIQRVLFARSQQAFSLKELRIYSPVFVSYISFFEFLCHTQEALTRLGLDAYAATPCSRRKNLIELVKKRYYGELESLYTAVGMDLSTCGMGERECSEGCPALAPTVPGEEIAPEDSTPHDTTPKDSTPEHSTALVTAEPASVLDSSMLTAPATPSPLPLGNSSILTTPATPATPGDVSAVGNSTLLTYPELSGIPEKLEELDLEDSSPIRANSVTHEESAALAIPEKTVEDATPDQAPAEPADSNRDPSPATSQGSQNSQSSSQRAFDEGNPDYDWEGRRVRDEKKRIAEAAAARQAAAAPQETAVAGPSNWTPRVWQRTTSVPQDTYDLWLHLMGLDSPYNGTLRISNIDRAMSHIVFAKSQTGGSRLRYTPRKGYYEELWTGTIGRAVGYTWHAPHGGPQTQINSEQRTNFANGFLVALGLNQSAQPARDFMALLTIQKRQH